MPTKPKPGDERQLVDRIRARLHNYGLARLEMTVIVLATGAVGFLLSGALLAVGVTSMAIRYALAVLGAYGIFLAFIRIWIEFHKRRMDFSADLLDGVPDVPVDLTDSASPLGGGGSSGGGGASGVWEPSSPGTGVQGALVPMHAPGSPSGGGSGSEALGFLDLDEGWVVLVPIVLAVGGVLAALLVVWSAPALLAEAVLDVVLVSTLYRRLKNLERRSWLRIAVRKTLLPVALVTVLLVVGGFAMQAALPQAESISDVFR